MEGANFAEIIKWIKEFDDKDPLLKEIQNIWQESQDDLNKAVETVSEAVKNLKEKGFIVIPGGWKSDPFGHAMLYMFQKQKSTLCGSLI